MKKSELEPEPRLAAACATVRAARSGGSEREFVLKAWSVSGAENSTAGPNQTRTVRPDGMKGAAASHAPERSSARTTMRPELGSAKDGNMEPGLVFGIGKGRGSLYFQEYTIVFSCQKRRFWRVDGTKGWRRFGAVRAKFRAGGPVTRLLRGSDMRTGRRWDVSNRESNEFDGLAAPGVGDKQVAIGRLNNGGIGVLAGTVFEGFEDLKMLTV